MEYFRINVKVGGFILLTLVLLVAAAIMVGNLGSLFAKKHDYTVLLRDASLLPQGSQVSYAGHPVGQVTAVEIRSDAVRAQQHPEYPVAVRFTMRAEIPLHQNARVELKTNGMIGDRYIDIVPGDGASRPAGSTVLGVAGGLEGMLASLSGVQGGAQDVMSALQTLLTDATRSDSIPGTLASLNRFLNELRPRLTTLTATGNELLQHVQQEVVSTSGKAGKVLAGINATLAENRPGLQRLVGDLNTTLAEARRTMDTTRDLLESSQRDVTRLMQNASTLIEGLQETKQELAASVQQLLTGANTMVVENDRNIYTTIENIRDMTEHLKAMSELLRANPAVILWGNRGDGTPGITNASSQRERALQDRGRIGRYDKAR